jgi:hypothetical protein
MRYPVQLYVPTEFRYPKRLRRVIRLGTEIARSIGRFGFGSNGKPITASLNDFDILYFTQFNQPTAYWTGIGWEDPQVRLFLNGLHISLYGACCLTAFWKQPNPDKQKLHLEYFVSFSVTYSENDWDDLLDSEWHSSKR